MNAMRFLNVLLQNINDEKYRKVIEFVFLWQDYNYWYNKKNPKLINGNGLPLDEQQALGLAQDETAKAKYNELKDKFLEKFRQIPANNRVQWQRDRLLNTGAYQQERLYNEEHCDLKDFLQVVYQIRCNFIHGSKIGDYVDIALIGWARDCLGELLGTIHYMEE